MFIKQQLINGITLILIICSSLLIPNELALADGNSMSISPAMKTVNAGESFDIVVTLNTDTSSRGGQCSLNFNASLVQCNSVTEGSFYSDWAQSHSGSTLVFPQPVIHNDTGQVTDIGIAIMGGGTGGPSGSGEFCIYHMTAKTGVNGTSVITLSNVVLTDQSGSTLHNLTVNNGQILVSPSTQTITPPETQTTTSPPNQATTSSSIQTTTPTGDSSQSMLPPEQSSIKQTSIDLSHIVDSGGVLKTNVQQQDIRYDENGWTVKLEIIGATRALTKDGNPLQGIIIQPNEMPPSLLPGESIIGSAIDFGPTGATFSPPISVTFEYDPSLLPKGTNETELSLAYFDTETQKWVKCDYTIDQIGHRITGYISHFSTFAILTKGSSGIGWSLTTAIILSELALATAIIFFIVRRRRAPVRVAVSSQTMSATALGIEERREVTRDSQVDQLPQKVSRGNAPLKTRMEVTGGKILFLREDGSSDIEIVNSSSSHLVISVEYNADLHPEGITKITIVDTKSESREPESKDK